MPSLELVMLIELIKSIYKEIEDYPSSEKELIENLACTVEHYENLENVH